MDELDERTKRARRNVERANMSTNRKKNVIFVFIGKSGNILKHGYTLRIASNALHFKV